MEFGKHLKRLRESKGYSIRQLSIKSGVSFGQISKIEQGTRGTPKPETIEKLAKGLGISYDYLMELAGYVEPEKPDQPVELTEFLRNANVLFLGQVLTEQDKQRVEDVLTALFFDALKKRREREEEE